MSTKFNIILTLFNLYKKLGTYYILICNSAARSGKYNIKEDQPYIILPVFSCGVYFGLKISTYENQLFFQQLPLGIRLLQQQVS